MTSTPSARRSPFTHLAAANLAAQAAEQVSLAAVPMVAVLMLGAGTRETGLLAAAQSLPFLLLALPLGLLADRSSRRGLMVVAEALRVLAMAAIAALVVWAAGAALSLPALALLGFAGAVGTVAFSVAAPAMVAMLVPRADLARANGQIELARSLAFAAGPALAGAIVAAAGGGSAFVLAALLSAAAVALLLRLPDDGAAARASDARRGTVASSASPASPTSSATTGAALPRRDLLEDLREGARFVWHDRWLRPILLTAVVWNTSWMVLQAAYVPHAMQHLGLGARGVGFTLSMYGAGMVLGALAASRLMARLPLGTAIAIGPAVSVVAAATMAATLLWPAAWLAALSFFLFGAGPIVWTVSSTTLRQTLTPGAMLGRVSSIFLTANAGARPLGAMLGTGVAIAAGADQAAAACLLLAAIGFVIQAALIIGSPVRTLRHLPQEARAAA